MPPSELGAYLQRHREERGWTLEDLESATRIRRRYLEALESGDWDALPPSVYTRGLIRNYARALGLRPQRVLRMYVKERPQEARLPEPQLISAPLITEPRVSVELVLAFGLLAVAAVLFAWMARYQLLPLIENATGRAPIEALSPGATPDTAPDAVRTVAAAATATATRPPASAATVRPLATRTPRRTPTPEPEGLIVEVEATSDVWLRVQADGAEVFADFLRTGQRERWEADENLRIRTGNAGGTRVTLNGQRIDSLGDLGTVKEVEWRLRENGDIEQTG